MDGKELRCSELDRLRAELHQWKQRAHEAERKLQEYDETHMELPVDADGVPIRIGDNMEATDDVDEDGRPYKQLATGYTMSKPDGKGNLWFTDDDGIAYDPMYSRHVNPRTIEDVLAEFAPKWVDTYNPDDKAALVDTYADELREMIGGDA